jgi:hypothetical protein
MSTFTNQIFISTENSIITGIFCGKIPESTGIEYERVPDHVPLKHGDNRKWWNEDWTTKPISQLMRENLVRVSPLEIYDPGQKYIRPKTLEEKVKTKAISLDGLQKALGELVEIEKQTFMKKVAVWKGFCFLINDELLSFVRDLTNELVAGIKILYPVSVVDITKDVHRISNELELKDFISRIKNHVRALEAQEADLFARIQKAESIEEAFQAYLKWKEDSK